MIFDIFQFNLLLTDRMFCDIIFTIRKMKDLQDMKKLKPIDIVNKYSRYGIILKDFSEKSQHIFFRNARQMGIANRYFDNDSYECENFISNAVYNGNIFLCFCDDTNKVGIYIFSDFNMAKEFVNKNEIYVQSLKDDEQDHVQDDEQDDRYV